MMRWLARLAVAAALWGALCLWANLDDRNPYYLGLAAAVLASLTVVWLCVDAYSVALPPQWEIHYSHSPGRTFDPRFSRLSQELAEAANRQAAATALHESIESLADGLLRDKYGIERGTDPEEAQRVLGPEVTAYLATEPRREREPFSPRLFDVLTRLESL